MSLTSQLKEADSPVSRFLNAKMKPEAVDALIARFNAITTRRPTLVTDGVSADIVGTSFDYAFRWNIEQFTPRQLVAWHGARDLRDERVIIDLVEMGNAQPDQRAACAIVLSWYERIFRSGHIRPELEASNVGLSSEGPYLTRLLAHVPAADLADVQRLMSTVNQVWGDRLKEQPYHSNPMFDGSPNVGGADADWIIGRTLYECKTTRKSRPFTREMFLQMIGYVLLDYSDRYKLEKVAWYFARHQLLIELPITNLFRDLPALRAEFKARLRPSAPRRTRSLARDLRDIAEKHHGDELDFDLYGDF
jgi:hypothetical protein